MTMSSSADEIEYLATEIITNSKPVSYHKFSRQLNIHVSKAKATLLEYYQNRNDLTATFIVTGSNDNGKLIKLSNEDDLESDLKKFTTVHCVHVYSVHKKLIQFSNNELALEELKHPSSLNKISEYEKNGIIIGPKLKSHPCKYPSSPVKPEPSHKNKPTEEKKSSSSLLSSYVSRKQEKKQQDTRSGTLSNYVSRKTEPTIPSKRSNTEPATKPTYQYKSRKLEAKAPKERVIIAETMIMKTRRMMTMISQLKPHVQQIHQIFRGCLMVTILLLVTMMNHQKRKLKRQRNQKMKIKRYFT